MTQRHVCVRDFPSLENPMRHIFAGGLLALAVPLAAQAHGYLSAPESRSLLCKQGVNASCGAIQYEPQSLEAPSGYPAKGPADGRIASAGLTQFGELDEQTSARWAKRSVKAGPQTFTWTVTANHAALGESGMVIDFAAVKGVVGKWIDDNWDHRPILNKDDSLLKADGVGRWLSPEELAERFGVEPFVMDREPTAENMARFLFDRRWFPPPSPTTPYRVTRVTVWETDTCSATHGHEVPR
jgi:6-pyruvoyl-tetrahydropterin synthase